MSRRGRVTVTTRPPPSLGSARVPTMGPGHRARDRQAQPGARDRPWGAGIGVDTRNYVRFEQVSAVETTELGLLAQVHGEQFRVEVVRPDIVRFAIIRGGVFDESPTFAVCVDPFGEVAEFTVEQGPDVVRLHTLELVGSLWLDPFRLDVHRTDGTPVIEPAADDDGHFWPYATLNDAFTVRRRCRPEDAVYGLGRRAATITGAAGTSPSGTPTCSTRTPFGTSRPGRSTGSWQGGQGDAFVSDQKYPAVRAYRQHLRPGRSPDDIQRIASAA